MRDQSTLTGWVRIASGIRLQLTHGLAVERDEGAVALLAAAASADGTGFFTSAHPSQSRWEYSRKCAVRHGAQLQGGGALDLAQAARRSSFGE
jgi:hypothetical protein